MKGHTLDLIVALLVFISCSSGGKGEKSVTDCSSAQQPTELALPDVPSTMTDPAERLAYVMDHFWDRMDWRDSTLLTNSAFMEQNLANYYQLITIADSTAASHAVGTMIEAILDSNPQVLNYFSEMSALYLYEPDSPMYDTESYAVILDALLARPECPDGLRMILADEHRQTMTNRVGTRAADFDYITPDGSRSTLHNFVGAPTTILLFYDPDCNICADAEHRLASDATINRSIAEGKTRILAIAPFDVDPEVWRRHATTLPSTWTVGYSPNGAIDRDAIYAIRALPAFYILTSNGTITLRDAAAYTKAK